jgi:hypothetical protein
VAVRALRRRAGFSIAVVLTMAVAIGANTAIFSVYDRLVLNPVTLRVRHLHAHRRGRPGAAH